MSGVLSFLAGMGSGAIDAQQRKRKQDAEDEDRAFQNEQRDRTRQQWQRDDALRTSMVDAAKPVTTTQAQLQGPTMDDAPPLPVVSKVVSNSGNSTSYATPAQADQAAATINAQSPIARMSDAYTAAGQPIAAMQLRSADRAEQLGKIQLDDAQTAHLNKQFDADLEKKATDFDGLADFISSSAGDGQGGAMKVKAVASADGKKVTIAKLNDDGSLSPTPYTFDNNAAGLVKAKALLSRSVTPEGKLTHLHQQAMEDLEAKKNDSLEKYQQGMLKNNADKIAMMQTIQELKNAAKTPTTPPPLWNDKADEFLKSRYTGKDEMTGATTVDGAGMQFAKTIALAKARANGGDTTMALGNAFEVDNRLRAAAGGDKNKLDILRQQYIQAITQPPRATPTTAAPASVVPTAPQASMVQAAPAPAPAPAPAVDPMATKFAQETMELNTGKRLTLSPDVMAYQDQQRAARQAAVQAADNAARAADLARRQKLAREQAAASR